LNFSKKRIVSEEFLLTNYLNLLSQWIDAMKSIQLKLTIGDLYKIY